jgi:hypothetical protein
MQQNNVVSFFRSTQRQSAIPANGRTSPASDSHHLVDPLGGWEPAGFDTNGSYVILSKKTGRLVTLRPEQLNEKKLRAVIGSRFCDEHCTAVDPDTLEEAFSPTKLADAIAEACDDVGEFDFARVRGPGLHLDGDDLVVHYGKEVRTAAGEPVYAHPTPGCAYQVGPSLDFGPDTPRASSEDIKSLLATVQSFGLVRPVDEVALLGWFVMAFYGAVVPHRPNLRLTAERGSGKSTLIDLFATLLGPQAYCREGVPTVAQVLYELEDKKAALLLDEFEARGSKKRAVEDLLEFIRGAFTNGTDGRQVRVRNGKSHYFNAPSGVLLAAVSLPAFDPATESRTVQVQLEPLPEQRGRDNPLLGSQNRPEVADLGRRLRRLLVQRWPVMRDAMAALRPLLVERGHEPRAVDKLTPLLAGYVALTNELLPGCEALDALITRCDLHEVRRDRAPRDCEECLRVLLSRKVRIFRREERGVSSSLTRVVEVIRTIANPDLTVSVREGLDRQLQEFGLRLKQADDTWQLAVCASQHHEGVRRMMQGTGWANGGWKDVLSRLPGAQYTTMRVAKICERVVVVDLPMALFETFDEDGVEQPKAGKSEDEAGTTAEAKGEWLE